MAKSWLVSLNVVIGIQRELHRPSLSQNGYGNRNNNSDSRKKKKFIFFLSRIQFNLSVIIKKCIFIQFIYIVIFNNYILIDILIFNFLLKTFLILQNIV